MQPTVQHDHAAAPSRRPLWQGAIQLILLIAALGVLAFGAAGTLDQPWMWLFLATYLASLVLTWFVVHDEELFAERSQAGAGVKGWDRFFSLAPALFMTLILIVAGLDARFHWSQPVSPLLHLVGWLLTVLALALLIWAMRANTFFARVVRIQPERGHRVVSTGPYAYVRHPGYIGMCTLGLAIPLMLGSWWAFVPGILEVGLLVVRTALEDRTLQAELPGYREYAARVRYRLLPGIW
jgi:protein-S-isoprenylcysteine O-methyltransferase Ste14